MARYVPLLKIEARLKRLDEQEFETYKALDRIQSERKLLQSLRGDAIVVADDAEASNGVSSPPKAEITVKEAILRYISTHPRRLSGELAVELAGMGIASSSQNPRKTIQTMLGQLREKGQVVRDSEGRFKLP